MAADWLAPTSLEEALALRAEHGDDATVVAGGRFWRYSSTNDSSPRRSCSPYRASRVSTGSGPTARLHLGALVTHSAVERSAVVRERWPAVAYVFSVVASPRIRNQATVGGVLGDADASGVRQPCCPRSGPVLSYGARVVRVSSRWRSSSSGTTRHRWRPTS